MISEKVCNKCYSEKVAEFNHTKEMEGFFRCYQARLREGWGPKTYTAKFGPPLWCPYKFEHAVSVGDNK